MAGHPRPTATDRIEEALMEDIATGRLKPGQRLDELALTQRFGVSRTPIREALNRLAAQGILVPSGLRGLKSSSIVERNLLKYLKQCTKLRSPARGWQL